MRQCNRQTEFRLSNRTQYQRNTQTHHIAKNASMQDYMYATAFEALIGYLYLTKQDDRLFEMMKMES